MANQEFDQKTGRVILPVKPFPKLPQEVKDFFPSNLRALLERWEKEVDEWRKSVSMR